MIVTEWFTNYVRPVRKGWYECTKEAIYTDCKIFMMYWNGKRWLYEETTKHSSAFGTFSSDKWRGLAVKP